MEQSTHETDKQNSSKPAELLSTLEEKLRHSFASPTSLIQSQESNGESAPAEAGIRFEQLPISEMTENDVKALDDARKSSQYIYDFTVQEFAEALQRGDYDIWKLRGIEDCLCILLTTYELYPHSRHLMAHYLAGENCGPYMKEIKGAIKQIMLNGNCEKTVYMAPNAAYAKMVGGKKLAVFYEMTED